MRFLYAIKLSFMAIITNSKTNNKINSYLFSALVFSLSSHAFTLDNLFSFPISARAISVDHKKKTYLRRGFIRGVSKVMIKQSEI